MSYNAKYVKITDCAHMVKPRGLSDSLLLVTNGSRLIPV